jgi:hypothetical protein
MEAVHLQRAGRAAGLAIASDPTPAEAQVWIPTSQNSDHCFCATAHQCSDPRPALYALQQEEQQRRGSRSSSSAAQRRGSDSMAEYGVKESKGGISHASSNSLAGQSVNSDSEAVLTAGTLNASLIGSVCAVGC